MPYRPTLPYRRVPWSRNHCTIKNEMRWARIHSSYFLVLLFLLLIFFTGNDKSVEESIREKQSGSHPSKNDPQIPKQALILKGA